MFGETWAFYVPKKAGTDNLGVETVTYTEYIIENVLTRKSSTEDLGVERPNGASIDFVLGLPKDLPYGLNVLNLQGGYAISKEAYRDNGKYYIIGSPQITRPCPTKWNTIVYVGRSNG